MEDKVDSLDDLVGKEFVLKCHILFLLQVRRRLSEIFAQAQAEVETLKKTENELRAGQSKLEDLGRRLDQEQVFVFYLHSCWLKRLISVYCYRRRSK